MNQSDVDAIVRHLVDEKWGRRFPMHAGRRDVPLAKVAQFARDRARPNDRRPRISVRFVAVVFTRQLARELRHIRQLNRALDQRVARHTRSSNVDPARGNPVMKIGSGLAQPPVLRCAKKSPVNSRLQCCT